MCKLIDFETAIGSKIKIADIKINHIKNIVEQVKKCSSIEAIILFGSSLEERCRKQSDIDIVIISKYTVNKLCNIKSFNKFTESIYSFDIDQDYDQLYFKSLEEIEKNKDKALICKELIEKGKVIYKKEI